MNASHLNMQLFIVFECTNMIKVNTMVKCCMCTFKCTCLYDCHESWHSGCYSLTPTSKMKCMFRPEVFLKEMSLKDKLDDKK